jgi:DNA-binding transcriptional MerR regulator
VNTTGKPREAPNIGTATREGLRVAELAAMAGISPDTVRYYERAGLLAAPTRTPAGYRSYPLSTVERLRFVQGCQRLGLRLREIAELLAVRDTGVCPCEPAEQLLRRHLHDLDVELTRLAALRSELVRMVEALPGGGCPDPSPGTWCPSSSVTPDGPVDGPVDGPPRMWNFPTRSGAMSHRRQKGASRIGRR